MTGSDRQIRTLPARVLAHAMLDDGEDVIRIIECLETRFGLPPRVAEDIVERAQEER